MGCTAHLMIEWTLLTLGCDCTWDAGHIKLTTNQPRIKHSITFFNLAKASRAHCMPAIIELFPLSTNVAPHAASHTKNNKMLDKNMLDNEPSSTSPPDATKLANATALCSVCRRLMIQRAIFEHAVAVQHLLVILSKHPLTQL